MEKKFDRSSFMEVLWKLMLPIVLQNLLSAVVSTADVLMLTHVSQTALSASPHREYSTGASVKE